MTNSVKSDLDIWKSLLSDGSGLSVASLQTMYSFFDDGQLRVCVWILTNQQVEE